MQSLKFKKNSWHYKLLNFYDAAPAGKNISICAYMWKVIFMMIVSVILSAGATFLATILVGGLVALLLHLIFGTNIPSFFAAGVFFDSVLAFGITSVYLVEKYRNRERVYNKEPGFVKSAWNAHKDKVCVPVEFE